MLNIYKIIFRFTIIERNNNDYINKKLNDCVFLYNQGIMKTQNCKLLKKKKHKKIVHLTGIRNEYIKWYLQLNYIIKTNKI